MTCFGEKSSEIKDDLLLITMFAGTQANAYNQFLQGGYMDTLRLYSLLTINQSINLQVYGAFQWSMFADTQANVYNQTLEGPAIINQSINQSINQLINIQV